jgi:hypothetical protein
MSIAVGDVLRVVAIMAWLDGNLNMNVFNAVIGGTGGPFDEADIVDDAVAWMNAIYGNMTGSTSDELDGSEIAVYVYDSVDDDFDEVGTDPWTYNPTSASEQLPRGVAGLINANTIDPDVQGKKYLGGLVEPSVTDGLWIAAQLANLALWADDWVTAFTGGTSGASWIPGVWSPTRTNFYPFSGAYTIPAIPAYQRRRKRGVGA